MKSRFAAAPSVYYCGGRGDFVVYRAVAAANQAKNDVMCCVCLHQRRFSD